MKHYNVVIIGAGPSGLNCGLKLEASGIKVLIIDKSNNPGSKICAGGMRLSDLKKIAFPENLILAQNQSIGVVDRIDLYEFLLKKLENTNVQYLSETKLTHLKENVLTINDKEKISFDYLVGADGSNSTVRRMLGIKSKFSLYTYQYNVPGSKFDTITIDSNPALFNCWYAWIFPNKNGAFIGCCANSNIISPGILKNNFFRWLENKHIDVTRSEMQSYPINCDFQGYRFKNVFLVGDACGLADEYTGEGIHQALVSGEEVANMILDQGYSIRTMKELIAAKLMQRSKIIKFQKRL